MPGYTEVTKMRRSKLLASIILTLAVALPAAAQEKKPPAAAPGTQPVSISPAMPVVTAPPADPSKMAAPAGDKAPGGLNMDPSYVFGAGDTISVSVWGDPEFDGQFIISPDGTISLKLVGEVRVAGLTRQQAQDAVDRTLTKEIKNPRSSLNLLASNSKHIYFDGDGISAGIVPLVGPIR